MSRKPLSDLPRDDVELGRLSADVKEALNRCKSLVDRLSALNDTPEYAPPLLTHELGGGYRVVVTARWTIPAEVVTAALGCEPLLPYLHLSPGQRADLAGLCNADTPTAHRLLPAVFGPPARQDAPVVGRGPFAGIPTVSEMDNGEMSDDDQLRVKALAGLFAAAVDALADLDERLGRTVSPPGVRDRVRVDRDQGRVTIDGVTYALERNGVLLFHHLVQAEGHVTTGPKIKKADPDSDFRMTRTIAAIRQEYPELARMLVTKKKGEPNFGVRLVLPPRR